MIKADTCGLFLAIYYLIDAAFGCENMFSLVKRFLAQKGRIFFALRKNSRITAKTHVEKLLELKIGHTLVGFAGLVFDPKLAKSEIYTVAVAPHY